MSTRLDRLRSHLAEAGLDGLVVSNPANILYLCGATGTAAELLVTRDASVLLSNFVDVTENAETASGVAHRLRTDPAVDIATVIADHRLGRVGVEAHCLPHATYDRYVEAVTSAEVVPTTGMVERLRWAKADDEIERIQRGMAINDLGCQYALEHAREGITEVELAAGIECTMRKAGADRLAFLIVQFGENAAKPHHRPSARRLQHGDFILVDIGAICQGYGSDTTRTFIFGEATPRQRLVYETVREAQLAALTAVQAGVSAADVHAASADIIAAAGYAAYYGHGVGHGINEGPSLRPGSQDVLAEGNTITIEPGIYVPRWGGVRIEDTVAVTADGYRNLASFPKDLTVIPAR